MIRSVLCCAVVVFCALSFAKTASALEGHEALLKEEGWREDEEYVKQDQRNIEPAGVAASRPAKKEVAAPRAAPKSAYKKTTRKRTGGGAKKVYHTKKRVRGSQKKK